MTKQNRMKTVGTPPVVARKGPQKAECSACGTRNYLQPDGRCLGCVDSGRFPVAAPKAAPKPVRKPAGRIIPELEATGIAAEKPFGENAPAPKPTGIKAAIGKAVQPKGQDAPHVVVEARAGTGKTFTLVVGLAYMVGGKVWDTACRVLGFTPEPSPQQRAVWEALRQGTRPRSVAYLAFNKSIVDEFSSKYQWLVKALADAGVALTFSTVHSMGNGAVKNGLKRYLKVNKYKTQNLMESIMGCDIREVRKTQAGRTLVTAVEGLVSKCKLNLIGWDVEGFRSVTDDELDATAVRYDIECNGQREKAYDLTRQVLEASKDSRMAEIDFDDMVWLPTVCGFRVNQYDLVLGDEAQDWNRSQQEIILKAGRRLFICGDPKQAIYGFAGADTDSIPRMTDKLRAAGGADVLPLTVTRRCGKAIVDQARMIVPDFEAHEGNGAGQIDNQPYEKAFELMADHDMVLCRTNAPLVGTAFRLIKAGRKANIKGRDIGEGLIRLIRKLANPDSDVGDLVEKVEGWYAAEVERVMRFKNGSDEALMTLSDKQDCLMAFTEGAVKVQDVITAIDRIFSDTSKGGVLLASVHRAKGLEADRVFILKPGLMPHPMAKSAWAQEQEQHLRYVAITRAIKTLVYVADAPEA